MNKLFTKRIQKEIALCRKENFTFPNLYVKPLESNLHKWYFIVYNLVDTPFEYGYYFGEMTLPTEYPIKAPDFKFYTPNGRFETNVKICTDFTAFHQNTYSSSQTVVTMLQGVISFMTDPQVNSSGNTIKNTTGLGGLHTSTEQRQQLALDSLNWNINNKLYMSIFSDLDVNTLPKL